MATEDGQVTLHGGFPAGAKVFLYEKEYEEQQRSREGQKPVAKETVGTDNELRFTGLKVGARYLAEGLVDGFPRVKSLRANRDGEVAEVVQPAVRPDVPRTAGQVQAAVSAPVRKPDHEDKTVDASASAKKAAKAAAKKAAAKPAADDKSAAAAKEK